MLGCTSVCSTWSVAFPASQALPVLLAGVLIACLPQPYQQQLADGTHVTAHMCEAAGTLLAGGEFVARVALDLLAAIGLRSAGGSMHLCSPGTCAALAGGDGRGHRRPSDSVVVFRVGN